MKLTWGKIWHEFNSKDFRKELAGELKKDLLLLSSIFIVFLGINQHYRLVIIPTESMYPVLKPGDVVLVDVKNMTFERGEILGFSIPEAVSNEKETLVKRVVGLPHESIEIRDGNILIDGEVLDEPYVYDEPSHIYSESLIPEDCYFMLGDNRNHSFDSSYWGENGHIPAESFKGKIIYRIFPLNRWGKVE